jgi:hypothetical protein
MYKAASDSEQVEVHETKGTAEKASELSEEVTTGKYNWKK